MSILCLINHEDVSSFPGMPESVFSLLQDIARDVIRYLHADAGLEGHSPDRLESYIARAESLSDAYDELALVVNEKELGKRFSERCTELEDIKKEIESLKRTILSVGANVDKLERLCVLYEEGQLIMLSMLEDSA